MVVVDGLLCFLLLGCGGRGTRRRSVRKGAVRERRSACESLHTSSADHDDCVCVCVWVGVRNMARNECRAEVGAGVVVGKYLQ